MQFSMKNLDQLSLNEMEELLSSSRKVTWQTEDNEAKYAGSRSVEGASSRCAYSTGCPSRPGSCRRYRQKVGFDFVVMLGDNVYGGESPEDFGRKFEIPYKPLLEAGVKFYASPGNHDNPNERFYQPYNLNARENCALTT
jgi:hypothetical protein